MPTEMNHDEDNRVKDFIHDALIIITLILIAAAAMVGCMYIAVNILMAWGML